jgi:hypothetical protein
VLRVCEAKYAKPAVNQGSSAGCHDAPFCGGVVEGVEEVTAPADFDGIGAVFLGDAAFDKADICWR